MENRWVPVFLPRFIEIGESDCECSRSRMDMEFKAAILYHAVRDGEPVKKGMTLFEGEVEKISFEIFSPADGILRDSSFSDGDFCDVHKPLAFIELKNG